MSCGAWYKFGQSEGGPPESEFTPDSQEIKIKKLNLFTLELFELDLFKILHNISTQYFFQNALYFYKWIYGINVA